MKRIIIIDGCSANIIFPAADSSMPIATTTLPGGRLQRSAIALCEARRTVSMMGEAGRDPLGDLIVNHLDNIGIDTSCIDRYSDGAVTPSILIFPSDPVTRSTVYPVNMAEHWDSTWPRIEASDIVVFGGFFSLQPRVRNRLTEFLAYARERHLLTVYLPGFNPALAPAVTRYMPSILENLELADVVVTSTPDLAHLFGISNPADAFSRKVNFYTPLMINFDPLTDNLSILHASESLDINAPSLAGSPDSPVLSALPLAAAVSALSDFDIAPDAVASLRPETIRALADHIAAASISPDIVAL